MRELKFRVWGKYIKEYFSADGGEPYTYTLKEISEGIIYDLDGLIIEQYTGLKDKNGKEIYEGDIVKDKWSDDFYKVEFDLDRAGFFPFACGDGCGCCETYVINDSDDVEIIGNIHENPSYWRKNNEPTR